MNLQNMAPNAKRAALVTCIFSLVAAGIYLAMVTPTDESLSKTRKEIAQARKKHSEIMANLARAAKTQERVAAAKAGLEPYEQALLVPLLESTAMRAKSLLDPLVLGAGLTAPEYESLAERALPLTPRPANQLYARLPIKIVCRGSFQGAVSFLLRLEKEFPLVTLQSFSVTAGNTPEYQTIDFILEWPAKGATLK